MFGFLFNVVHYTLQTIMWIGFIFKGIGWLFRKMFGIKARPTNQNQA